jgi:pimeloyl-ACP methyl ester carboxylesterase
MACRSSSAIERVVTIGAQGDLKADDPVREILASVTAAGWREKFPETYESYQRLNPEPDFDAFAGAVIDMWLDSGPSGYPDEAVEEIACKVLLARGEDDPLTSSEALSRLARRIPHSRVLNIADAGHVAFQDQPEMFMRSLNEFLE